jgi:hypothetical protein
MNPSQNKKANMKNEAQNQSGLCLVSYDDNQTEIRHFEDSQTSWVKEYMKSVVEFKFDPSYPITAMNIKMLELGIFQDKYDVQSNWQIAYFCDVVGDSVKITNTLQTRLSA